MTVQAGVKTQCNARRKAMGREVSRFTKKRVRPESSTGQQPSLTDNQLPTNKEKE